MKEVYYDSYLHLLLAVTPGGCSSYYSWKGGSEGSSIKSGSQFPV